MGKMMITLDHMNQQNMASNFSTRVLFVGKDLSRSCAASPVKQIWHAKWKIGSVRPLVLHPKLQEHRTWLRHVYINSKNKLRTCKDMQGLDYCYKYLQITHIKNKWSAHICTTCSLPSTQKVSTDLVAQWHGYDYWASPHLQLQYAKPCINQCPTTQFPGDVHRFTKLSPSISIPTPNHTQPPSPNPQAPPMPASPATAPAWEFLPTSPPPAAPSAPGCSPPGVACPKSPPRRPGPAVPLRRSKAFFEGLGWGCMGRGVGGWGELGVCFYVFFGAAFMKPMLGCACSTHISRVQVYGGHRYKPELGIRKTSFGLVSWSKPDVLWSPSLVSNSRNQLPSPRGIGVLKVVAPIGSDRFLPADVPHVPCSHGSSVTTVWYFDVAVENHHL